MNLDEPKPGTAPASALVPAADEHRLMVLMFTDLVDSSGLKAQLGDVAYAQKIAKPHNKIFRDILARFAGAQTLNYTGDGFLASFRSVGDAVDAALLFHHALRIYPWDSRSVATRVGIHVGEAVMIEGNDPDKMLIASHAADMCARLMNLGAGGQTLLTRHAFDDARQYVRAHPPVSDSTEAPQLEWAAHGRYRFKGHDNNDPLEVFEVGAVGLAPLKAPPNSDKAQRVVSLDEEDTLGWRPSVCGEVPGRPNWQLDGKLGVGGFGEVWLVKHRKTGEGRVFKFCFDAERLRSLKRELTIFRLIREALGDRDDIARLYDVRLDKAPFYLESEYVASGNLTEWVEKRGGIQQIPMVRRLALMSGICRAVAAAHSIGVIHKDIKPSNVLMRDDMEGHSRPVLADFGIGVVSDHSQFERLGVTETGFTSSLIVGNDSSRTGTRMYAPPESLIGKAATIQSDIFALGVLLYQLCIGDLNRPLATGWERDVSDETLREDIAAATAGRTEERLHSVVELISRVETLGARQRQNRRRRIARKGAFGLAAAAIAIVLSVLGFQTIEKDRAGELANRIQKLIEEPSWSPDAVRQTDQLLDQLSKVSSKAAADERRRVNERMARSISEHIHRANLDDGDRQRIEGWIALLQPRDGRLADLLRKDLSERVRQWESAYTMRAPFDSDMPEGAKPDGDAVRFEQRRVPLPVSLVGNSRVEVVFDGVRALKTGIGFSLDYGAGQSYEFLLLPAQLTLPPRISLDTRWGDLEARLKGWTTSTPEAGSVTTNSGKPLLCVERRGDDRDIVEVERQFDAAPHRGKVWSASFRGRVTGMPGKNKGVAQLYIVAQGRDGKSLVSASAGISANSDWTLRTARLTVPEGATLISVRFQFKTTTGRLEVADFRINENAVNAPETEFGSTVMAQPDKEWNPAVEGRYRWMSTGDPGTVAVTGENKNRILRLSNEMDDATHSVVSRVRIDPIAAASAALKARLRIPSAPKPGPANWNVPRILMRCIDHDGRILGEETRTFTKAQDWAGLSFKRTIPSESEFFEVAIEMPKCKGVIEVSELSVDFERAASAVEAASPAQQVLTIKRNKTLLRQVAISNESTDGEALRVAGERSGSFLRFAVGQQRPTEVFDPLPLPSREHRAILVSSREIPVRQLSVFRQALPAKPEPIEVGDEQFASGQIGNALTSYETQLTTATDPDTRVQARFKLGMAFLQQKRIAEAETQFAEAAKSDTQPWAVLAASQLLVSYLAQKRVDEADAIFQILKSRRDFTQFARMMDDGLQRSITAGYIDRYRLSLEVGSPAEWYAGIEKLTALLDLGDVLNLSPGDRWALLWHTNRFYEATGQIQRAAEDARKCVEQLEKEDITSIETWASHFCASYRRLAAQTGQSEKAWELIQKMDKKAPDGPISIEAIRCLIATGNLDEAESRVRGLLDTPVFATKPDATFILATSLLGVIHELRGEGEKSRAVWVEAMRRLREAATDGQIANAFGAGASRSALINLLILCGISGELRDDDLPGIRKAITKLYVPLISQDDSAAKAMLESLAAMVDRETLNALWISERGRAFSREFIRGEVLYPKYYSTAVVLMIEEILVQGTSGRANLTKEEEAAYFTLANDLLAGIREGKIAAAALLEIVAGWKGSILFTWGSVEQQLPSRSRGGIALLLGNRMAHLGKTGEAKNYYQTAIQLAKSESQAAIQKLSEAGMNRLGQ